MSSSGVESAAGQGEAASVAPPCKECVEGFLWTGEPAGEETSLGTLPAYVAKPDAAAPALATSAVLFIHDAFGWKYPNNRLLCDMLAKATGCHVYLPDFYSGAALVTEEQAKELIDPQPTFLGKMTQGLKFIAAAPGMLMALSKFGLKHTQPLVDLAVEEIKKLHGNEACKLGAVGYCWGGKYSLRLGAQGKAAACVACHPSLVDPSADELSKMSAACLFLRAETDAIFGERLWKQTEAAIKGTGSPLESILYPGTTHGFAVRCSEADEVSMKARDEALKETGDWFSKYLS